MAWTDKIFSYCERGTDPGLWAEPVNAISNFAFIVAAATAFKLYSTRPNEHRDPLPGVLILLTFIIGVGSGLFHTFADRWSVLADVIPIALFMLSYLYLALRRFVEVKPVVAIIWLVVFMLAMALMSVPRCADGFLALQLSGEGGKACLNGSLGYFPSFLAMAIIGSLIIRKNQATGRLLLTAAAIFLVSLTCRSLDKVLCPHIFGANWELGTHFLWHLLNGVTLYLLLKAAIMNGHQTTHTRKQHQ